MAKIKRLFEGDIQYDLKDAGISSFTRDDGGVATGRLVKLTRYVPLGDAYRKQSYMLFIGSVPKGKYLLTRKHLPTLNESRKLEKLTDKLDAYTEAGKAWKARKTAKKIRGLEKSLETPGGTPVYALPGSIYPLPDPEVKPTYDLGRILDRPITGIPAVAAGGALAYQGYVAGTAMGALYGAALIGSLGLLGFIPYILAKVYGAGKNFYNYLKDDRAYLRGPKERLLNASKQIISEFESLLAQQGAASPYTAPMQGAVTQHAASPQVAAEA